MRLPVLVLVLVAGLAALGGPVASAAVEDRPGPAVSILTASYGSPRIDVLAGDTVTWRNVSVRPHTVAATDLSWSSQRLTPTATFSHRFDAPGAVSYYCQVHPSMRAEVDVHRLLLTPPREVAAPDRAFELTGRAALPAGSTVSIESDDGKPAAAATVGPGGAFRATVNARRTTSFRAVAGDEASPPVQILVLDRRVQASARRRGSRVVVNTRVLPASPRATVVLQLHLRERFGWWPVQRTRLDADSRARFRLRLRHSVRARVLLTTSDAATPLAVSATLRLRTHR
jgi:plastocyanin